MIIKQDYCLQVSAHHAANIQFAYNATMSAIATTDDCTIYRYRVATECFRG